MEFRNLDGGVIVDELIRTICANRDYLSEIDGRIGDGDHGINMSKGFTLCAERLRGTQYGLSEGLATLGKTLLEDIGGSMGPLYGMFFDELSASCEGAQQIDAALFEQMLQNAIEAVQEIGSAKRGDKTLLDTLLPALDAYSEALRQGADFDTALQTLQTAAHAGWQATEGMIAKIGRASRLAERSRGVPDAGATSCYLILNSMAESIRRLLKEEN